MKFDNWNNNNAENNKKTKQSTSTTHYQNVYLVRNFLRMKRRKENQMEQEPQNRTPFDVSQVNCFDHVSFRMCEREKK